MNDVSSQIAVAQVQLVQRNQKVEGQQALALIQGATGQDAAPPQQPRSVQPKEGSTVEVVA